MGRRDYRRMKTRTELETRGVRKRWKRKRMNLCEEV
jgi:hypothetical protein